MPHIFAVVTKFCLAAFSLTNQPGAAGTTIGNNCIPAVWGRTPPAIRVSCQAAAQQELLVFAGELRVAQDSPDVLRAEPLRALWTPQIHSALRNLDAQILTQTA